MISVVGRAILRVAIGVGTVFLPTMSLWMLIEGWIRGTLTGREGVLQVAGDAILLAAGIFPVLAPGILLNVIALALIPSISHPRYRVVIGLAALLMPFVGIILRAPGYGFVASLTATYVATIVYAWYIDWATCRRRSPPKRAYL